MCETCKIMDGEYREASAILLMMIGKIHAIVDKFGAMDINIKLDPAESDWLCEWGAANEDIEDDDPEEEDADPAS
jgi:hypothetical protein